MRVCRTTHVPVHVHVQDKNEASEQRVLCKVQYLYECAQWHTLRLHFAVNRVAVRAAADLEAERRVRVLLADRVHLEREAHQRPLLLLPDEVLLLAQRAIV